MVTQIEEETGTLPPNLPRGVTPEVAAGNPDVQAIIAPRLTMLMEIANSFLLTIIESMETVPYGIRWICKQIRSLTRVCPNHMFSNDPRLMHTSAQIPRRDRLCHLLPYRRVLLFAIHQSCYSHPSGLHASRRCSGQASTPNANLGEYFLLGSSAKAGISILYK